MRLLLSLLIVGCGGGSSLTELEGIYTITTWTDNTASCDAEGPSVLDQMTDTALFVKIENFLGQKFVNAVRCIDLVDCQAKAAEDTIFLDGYAFEKGSDEDGWTGSTIFASGIDTCQGSVTDHVMTAPADGALHFESKTRNSLPFDKDSEGFCNTDDAKAAAEGQPCVELEVITATFADDL
jgi:hypothetical protein